MKTLFSKNIFKKVKGNRIFSFLFFLLVSCSLWLSLTLNRIYETNISVCVHIRNIPDGVRLEGGTCIEVPARIEGAGTDMFGYIFDDVVDVTVDYSCFVRDGGSLSMSVNSIRGQVNNALKSSLSLQGFAVDSLRAQVQRVSSKLPVVKDLRQLITPQDYELLSPKYSHDSVEVTAYVDVMPSISAVYTEPLVCNGLVGDSIFELRVLPGDYISVSPEVVKVNVSVSRYLERTLPVLVDYAEFPDESYLGLLPEKVTVKFEVLEINSDKVAPTDFTVRIWYEDFLRCIRSGGGFSALEKEVKVECASPYVRKVSFTLANLWDFSSVLKFSGIALW